MARFEATVRLFDIVEADAHAAWRMVEEQLRAAGFPRCRVTGMRLQEAAKPVIRARSRPMRTPASYAGGGLLIAAFLAWAMWFIWLLTE
jgi:hypothetical protein